ncbi:MAG TPA: MBL fold metallo-hydrolase [Desulfatiglandales bacterium]|nr:MBL fold metallo-hydrolase [Desulfatiglandales bacterium]
MPVHLIKAGYANTYLIEDGGFFVAVDVGTSMAARKIFLYFSERSIDTDSLKMVTATHFHIDHVGGISGLVQLFPETRVCFSALVRDYINGKVKLALISPAKWINGLLPVLMAEYNHIKNATFALLSDKVAIPLPVLRNHLSFDYRTECILEEEQPIPYLSHWVLIKTPGHSPDSVCLYNRAEHILISGDTILNMRGSGELNKFCSDYEAIKESFNALLPLKIKALYPGHGKPLCNIEGLMASIKQS